MALSGNRLYFMKVEVEGLEDLDRKLEWLKDNFENIKRYTLSLLCVEMADLLGAPDDLHFIEIKSGQKTFFGVSLEPPLERKTYKEIDAQVMYYMPLDTNGVNEDVGLWVQKGNPWVSDQVPVEVGRAEGEGFFFLRDAAIDAMEIVRKNNIEYLETRPRRIQGASRERIASTSQVYTADDLRYNQARAEFGIGDSPGSPTWRPALRKLVNERIEQILELVLDSIVETRIPFDKLPDFEPRPESWLEDNADFVLTITS